jgi:hypothetical protein
MVSFINNASHCDPPAGGEAISLNRLLMFEGGAFRSYATLVEGDYHGRASWPRNDTAFNEKNSSSRAPFEMTDSLIAQASACAIWDKLDNIAVLETSMGLLVQELSIPFTN